VLPPILRSGKHVLTEKPIGRSATEAAALVALAEQSPAVTGVGFSFRRLPGLASVRNLVADEAHGTVHSFTAWSTPTTPPHRRRRSAGATPRPPPVRARSSTSAPTRSTPCNTSSPLSAR
jgi:predicted dehydrogenase